MDESTLKIGSAETGCQVTQTQPSASDTGASLYWTDPPTGQEISMGSAMEKILKLVQEHMGLNVTEKGLEDFARAVLTRCRNHGISELDDYCHILTKPSPKRDAEWEALAASLTVPETHFFRDQGQVEVLRSRILPDLIARNAESRSLRLWSAGCSSGEEPYSLAIMVDELIPDKRGWDILIIGTDINPQIIERARRGVYTKWSFRTVDPDNLKGYFKTKGTGWQLDERVRDMVTLRTGNLVRDPFPSWGSGLHGMDLIVCRNVFIYFAPSAVSAVLRKFVATLSPGGYLITGHGELWAQSITQLTTKVFPDSVVYQRSDKAHLRTVNSTIHAPAKPSAHAGSGRSAVRTDDGQAIKTPPNRAQVMQDPSSKNGAGKNGDSDLSADPHHGDSEQEICTNGGSHDNVAVYCLKAQELADQGEYEQAIGQCHQAIKMDAFAVAPYVTLAHIAQDKGDLEGAKGFFDKAIYLSPTTISAYLELGWLYQREGDAKRAGRMQSTALALLKAMPLDAPIEPYEDTTAGTLVTYLEGVLAGKE